MPLSKNVMGGGVSAGMAKAILGSIATGLSAAGTTQATATSISADRNIVSTVAASSGVVLPSCDVGDSIEVYNNQGTNDLTVYPDSSSTINQLSANVGALLGVYRMCKFTRVTTTGWIANLSA